MGWELLCGVAFAFLLGAGVRSVFGFGDALVAMPLMLLWLPLSVAAPIMAILSSVLGVMLLIQERRALDWRRARFLIVWAALGAVLGLLLLTPSAEAPMKILLGSFIVVFALLKLKGPISITPPPWLRRVSDTALAITSGVFMGAFSIAGPPAVVYASSQGWPPATFRATLHTYFLAINMLVMIGHGASGLWNVQVGLGALVAVPSVIVAMAAGTWLRGRLEPARFEKSVYVLLVVLGLGLVLM